MQQECVELDIITFVGMNACASVLALEEGWYVNQQIIPSMLNLGAWRLLGERSTRCHLEMWSLGMPYLEDVRCTAMVRKLLNILNGCAK